MISTKLLYGLLWDKSRSFYLKDFTTRPSFQSQFTITQKYFVSTTQQIFLFETYTKHTWFYSIFPLNSPSEETLTWFLGRPALANNWMVVSWVGTEYIYKMRQLQYDWTLFESCLVQSCSFGRGRDHGYNLRIVLWTASTIKIFLIIKINIYGFMYM